MPLIAPHFNITVEIPLKAIVRGYSWTVIPITWRNRRTGEPKLTIKEMGSRYLFICLYIWLEKYFSRGDYRKRTYLDQAREGDASLLPTDGCLGRAGVAMMQRGDESGQCSAAADGPC